MFDSIFEKLNDYEVANRNELIETRRRALRYPGTGIEAIIAGHPYNITDWSVDGVLFETPSADADRIGIQFGEAPAPRLYVGATVKMALRFHVMDETIEIPVEGRITRQSGHTSVARFDKLSPALRRKFERVRDLQNAEGFLGSQHTPDDKRRIS